LTGGLGEFDWDKLLRCHFNKGEFIERVKKVYVGKNKNCFE
jgi:hypothetical protein